MVIRFKKCIVCQKPFLKRLDLTYPRQTYKGKSVGRKNQVTCGPTCSRIYSRINSRINALRRRHAK